MCMYVHGARVPCMHCTILWFKLTYDFWMTSHRTRTPTTPGCRRRLERCYSTTVPPQHGVLQSKHPKSPNMQHRGQVKSQDLHGVTPSKQTEIGSMGNGPSISALFRLVPVAGSFSNGCHKGRQNQTAPTASRASNA